MPDETTFRRFAGSHRVMRKLLGPGTFSTATVVPQDVVTRSSGSAARLSRHAFDLVLRERALPVG